MIAAADDYTPTLADALDSGRDTVAPGVRAFLLEHTGPVSAETYRPIEIAADVNGEIPAGWMPTFSPLRDRMELDLCQMDDVTLDAVRRFAALAVLDPGETVAAVYKVAELLARPTSPVLRRWRFGLDLTARTFTPAGLPSGAAGAGAYANAWANGWAA